MNPYAELQREQAATAPITDIRRRLVAIYAELDEALAAYAAWVAEQAKNKN